MQIFFAHGFEVECTAQAIIEDKDDPRDAKAPLQTCQQSMHSRRPSRPSRGGSLIVARSRCEVSTVGLRECHRTLDAYSAALVQRRRRLIQGKHSTRSTCETGQLAGYFTAAKPDCHCSSLLAEAKELTSESFSQYPVQMVKSPRRGYGNSESFRQAEQRDYRSKRRGYGAIDSGRRCTSACDRYDPCTDPYWTARRLSRLLQPQLARIHR